VLVLVLVAWHVILDRDAKAFGRRAQAAQIGMSVRELDEAFGVAGASDDGCGTGTQGRLYRFRPPIPTYSRYEGPVGVLVCLDSGGRAARMQTVVR
jgi:hypothetical protein